MQKEETKIRHHFLANRQKLERLEIILKSREMNAFEYFPKQDKLILYDNNLLEEKTISGYMESLEKSQEIYPDDQWKLLDFLRGKLRGPIEVRERSDNGDWKRRILDALPAEEEEESVLVGYIRDITEQRKREEILEEQARRDSMTMLYNSYWGRTLIEGYLENKNPYASCGFLVIDIDYFKNVNDTYGHLFGDRVLRELADILRETFDCEDILVRTGGDEFVAFLKNIDEKSLIRKVTQLLRRVRNCKFWENGYSISCSVGICFLPENVSGYRYEQLFENADWALYQAKLNGRDRYELCDNLERFKLLQEERPAQETEIDIRYLKHEMIPTAFEILEKGGTFDSTLPLLLKVIGVRFRLDRITIIQTDLKNQEACRKYQWISKNGTETLKAQAEFSKEDFLTLFHSYDEYGTAVLQYDNLEMYSAGGRSLLMREGAKTVLYAAMYCEGQYIGAISYVVCETQRYWSRQNRRQIGELTQLISVYWTRNLALKSADYDRVQGKSGSSWILEEAGERQKQLDQQLLADMEKAIRDQEFKLYLQPKVSLRDGAIVGAEAQVRWHRSDGSVLYPDSFISLYEKNGRITNLDLYMFERVAEFLQKNERMRRKQVPISINASVLLASHPDGASAYLEILQKYGVDPKLTEIELLETKAVEDYDNVKKLFQRFREAGMKTSLDDFGAGYSMIHMLADIPVDTVKLDRSLIERSTENSRGFYLLRQIVSLIKGMGYEVLCEGVENEKQVELLKQVGCETVQGYLFYKPMSVEEYEQILEKNETPVASLDQRSSFSVS